MSRAHVPFLRSAERVVRRRSATRWSGAADQPWRACLLVWLAAGQRRARRRGLEGEG